jgi:MazG family protein
MKAFDELLEIMGRLRKECPWDREQDLGSLRKYLLEEAYECVGAIDDLEKSGVQPLIEELGDVLLQIVFQSEIISEKIQSPAIEKVIETLNQKLLRRHPHVFGEEPAETSADVLKKWDEIKKAEKGSPHLGHLDGISKSLTALQLAQKFGEKSKKIGFDWTQSQEVWKQVESELQELLSAKSLRDKEEEFGDLLFSLVQWARHESLDAETALARTNQKFLSRFKKMEEIAETKGENFQKLSLEEKEKLWQQAKIEEKR